MKMGRVAEALLIAVVAWGAFSFGAVYPWAYWPLAAGALVVGLVGVVAAREGASPGLIVALGVFAGATLLQLTPWPVSALERVTPQTLRLAKELDLRFAAGVSERHATSIQPALTWTGLALFSSFALLLIGASRLLSQRGAVTTVAGITVVGTVLAIEGIAQAAFFSGKMYGLWNPLMGDSPFGPFVNRNHFAGWMLLALPLSLGLACARITRALACVRPVWRDRVLWLASAEANQLVLLGAASATMALSLVLTMSRSGIGAMMLGVALIGWRVSRRSASAGRRVAANLYLLFLVLAVVSWIGPERIAVRFAETDSSALNLRLGAWRDAWAVVVAFPLVGTGLNTYGVASLFYQTHDLAHHYAEAHNDYLQLAAEGGLLLTLPAALCIVLLVRTVRSRMTEDRGSSTYWIRTGAVISLIVIGLQEVVDFSLQMPGNAALFAVVCAVALHKSPHRRPPAWEHDANLRLQ